MGVVIFSVSLKRKKVQVQFFFQFYVHVNVELFFPAFKHSCVGEKKRGPMELSDNISKRRHEQERSESPSHVSGENYIDFMVSKNTFVSLECKNLSLDRITMGFIACIRELKDGQ